MKTNMTYELAKQLKDAGFPQNHDYFDNDICTICIKCNDDQEKPNEIPCEPTLSELIEACPQQIDESVFTLDYYPRGWWRAMYASGALIYTSKQGGDLIQSGSTPEEAVAALWLKLREIDKTI